MTDALYNEFEGEEHRQVCGALGQPQTVPHICRYFIGTHLDGITPERVERILKDLEADGLAVEVGEHEDGHSLVEAVAEHSEARTLPNEQSLTMARRVNARPDKYLWGEFWALTDLGYAKLQAPVRDEPPPLAGLRLAAAEERTAEIEVENARLAREHAAAEVERIAERLEEAKEVAKNLEEAE